MDTTTSFNSAVQDYLIDAARPNIAAFHLVGMDLLPYYGPTKWNGDKLQFNSMEEIEQFHALYSASRKCKTKLEKQWQKRTKDLKIKLPGGCHLVRELELDQLRCATKHRRLSLYYHKGTVCATCGVDCSRLIVGKDPGGAIHTDLYDKYLSRMLTVGHIIPRASGGEYNLKNLRPLCHKCNSKEGNSFTHMLKDPELFNEHCRKKLVYKKDRSNFPNGEFFAEICGIVDVKGKVNFILSEGYTYQADLVKFVP